MAYLEDYGDDERRLQGQASGPGQSYAPAGGLGSAPQAQASSGMTPAPISAYFTANEPAAQGMASGIGTRVEDAGRQAVQDWDATKAQDAWGRARNLGTQEGIATELHDAYQDPGYTPGMGALDAYVATRASTPGQFDALRDRFASLDVNEVGAAKPEAPTMRDVGSQPLPEGFRPRNPGEDYVHDDVYEGSPGNASDPGTLKVHKPARYEKEYDAYADWEAKNNAWQKQRSDAQSEYDAANKKYSEESDAWNKKRQPFLDAFGL